MQPKSGQCLLIAIDTNVLFELADDVEEVVEAFDLIQSRVPALRPSWPPQVPQEITEGTEMEGQHKPLPDSGNGRSISPLSPFPPVQSQTHEPTGGNGENGGG